MTSVAYIDHDKLVELIKTGEAGKDYQIVDVRDDDFAGGNIVGALHQPSEEATNESINQLTHKLESVPKVIFHCALSQSRGPRAARAFASALDAQTPPTDKAEQGKPKQEVLILRNGWTNWSSLYADDPSLVENFEEKTWNRRQNDTRWGGSGH